MLWPFAFKSKAKKIKNKKTHSALGSVYIKTPSVKADSQNRHIPFCICGGDRNQRSMPGMFRMITDSANRQKSHFSQEMRRQRLVEALQNDTYLPITKGIWDKERQIAGEETRGSEVLGVVWGWGSEGESEGERYKGEREIAQWLDCRRAREEGM